VAKDKDPGKKADDAMKKQRDAVKKTENQINKGSFACTCGDSFGSQLLLNIHLMGCDG
jgi:hypothetical protein